MTGLFLKAGEFAQLCGVKKDTLLHYDHIGILKPEKIGENGYRYYSVKQLYTFDLISALKRLGMPLQEIKAYLDQRNPEAFLFLLREQQKALEQERRRLESVGNLLRETIHGTELARHAKIGEIFIEQASAEYYVAVRAPDFAHYDEPQFLLRTRSLLSLAREHGGLAFPTGDIITKESLDRGSFVEDYYYCRVPSETAVETMLIRPEGTYAVLYHQGSYETLEKAYEALSHWVIHQGYSIAGALYEEDLLHYMSTADPNCYVMKISLQISGRLQQQEK